MKKVITTTLATLSTFALPFVAAAQAIDTSNATSNFTNIGTFIVDIINNVLVPVLFALAFIVFIWGVFKTFVAGASDEEARAKGKSIMIYGIIGIAVMASVWGLVYFVTNTAGLNNNAGNVIPTGSGVTAP